MLSGLSAKVIALMTLLMQVLNVKADDGKDEDTWWMKFAINSVVFMALVGTASVILQIRAWLKPT